MCPYAGPVPDSRLDGHRLDATDRESEADVRKGFGRRRADLWTNARGHLVLASERPPQFEQAGEGEGEHGYRERTGPYASSDGVAMTAPCQTLLQS